MAGQSGAQFSDLELLGIAIGGFIGLPVLFVLVLYLVQRRKTTPEERRKIRRELRRDPKREAQLGGGVGFFVGMVAWVLLMLAFGEEMERWGVGMWGGDAYVPVTLVSFVICVGLSTSYFANRFRQRAWRRRSLGDD
ncbi:hypothetical protein ACGF5M_03175 [Gemmatimonadota bacterium]